MRYPKSLLILLLTLISLTSYSQKKNKKGAYDDYWKQQEQIEKAEAKSKEAHKLFQDGKLKLALTKYEEALKLNPEDQKTIAKIRDIKILLEEQIIIKEEAPIVVHAPEPKSDTLIPVNGIADENPTVLKDTLSESAPKIIFLDTLEEIKSIKKEEVVLKSEPAEMEVAKDKSTSVAETKTSKPSSTNKPYKNTENYRKYLATIYKEGWTEEKYKEGNKDIVKRVRIVGDHGDEYMKVTHHYGAVYYFKNGISISYGTWVEETKEVK